MKILFSILALFLTAQAHAAYFSCDGQSLRPSPTSPNKVAHIVFETPFKGRLEKLSYIIRDAKNNLAGSEYRAILEADRNYFPRMLVFRTYDRFHLEGKGAQAIFLLVPQDAFRLSHFAMYVQSGDSDSEPLIILSCMNR